MFRKKTKQYHAAAGEIRRYRKQTVRLHAHRVTRVNYLSNNRAYVIPYMEEDTASGRVEETILISQTIFTR